jgi:hypothetical protein
LAFSKKEYAVLSDVKGVGPNVIKRLEETSYGTLADLAFGDGEIIMAHGAAMIGSSCWKNSPQARAAIAGAIGAAQTQIARDAAP